MAEPFSIATGAVQVAGAGIQLAKTLYDVARDVRDAEKDIQTIACEVDLTAKVLENLAAVLNDDTTSQVCSPKLQQDAQAALDGCKEAFVQLETALRAMHRSAKTPMGKIRITARMKWPLTKPRMAEMRTNLERLKTLLSLMLEVINLASKQVKNPLQQSNERVEEDRRRIDRLIKSNEDLYTSLSNGLATVGIQSLIHMPPPSDKSIEPAQDTAWRLGHELAAKPTQERENGLYEGYIIESFEGCRRAIDRLMSTIDFALTSWKVSQGYEIEALDREVNTVRTLVAKLPRHTCSRPQCAATFASLSAALRHEMDCSLVTPNPGFLFPAQFGVSANIHPENNFSTAVDDYSGIPDTEQPGGSEPLGNAPRHSYSTTAGGDSSGPWVADRLPSSLEPSFDGRSPNALEHAGQSQIQNLAADIGSASCEPQTSPAFTAEAETQHRTAPHTYQQQQQQSSEMQPPQVYRPWAQPRKVQMQPSPMQQQQQQHSGQAQALSSMQQQQQLGQIQAQYIPQQQQQQQHLGQVQAQSSPQQRQQQQRSYQIQARPSQMQTPQAYVPWVISQSHTVASVPKFDEYQTSDADMPEAENNVSYAHPSYAPNSHYYSLDDRSTVYSSQSHLAESSQSIDETLTKNPLQSVRDSRQSMAGSYRSTGKRSASASSLMSLPLITSSRRVTNAAPGQDSNDKDEAAELHDDAAAAGNEAVTMHQSHYDQALARVHRGFVSSMNTVDFVEASTYSFGEPWTNSGVPVSKQDESRVDHAEGSARRRDSVSREHLTSQSGGHDRGAEPSDDGADDRVSKHEVQVTEQSRTDTPFKKRKLQSNALNRSVKKQARGRSSTGQHSEGARRPEGADDAVDMLLQRWTVTRTM